MISRIYHKIEPRIPIVKAGRAAYLRIFPQTAHRYKYLYQFIRKYKCKRIMEIGTWNGEHALKMIEEAKRHSPVHEISYYGFDLFEMFDNKVITGDYSKVPPRMQAVQDKLKLTGANIHLYKGYTKDILPEIINYLPVMDFIYIDGGHEIENIANDWEYSQRVMGQDTIVIFDDYWPNDKEGCKHLIDGLNKDRFNVKILPIQDKFTQPWGILKIRFAMVSRKLSRE